MNKYKEKIGNILNKIKGNKRVLYLTFCTVLVLFCLVLNMTFSLITQEKNVVGSNITIKDLKYNMIINEVVKDESVGTKEATNTAFNYLKANGNRISGQISTTTKDYIINYQDMQGIGMTGNLALPTLIAICSAALGKTPLNSLAILGEISIGGTLIKVNELASTLQVCLDSGAKKVLLPITSAGDLGTVPSDLVGAFSLIFYSSAEEAVFKALGVE